ncbi:MAG TPA: extracellular solute-binding protein [Solirubrobacteraceae bacterium]|nr:extracellular solute-binding protein [Solirubrobacteraceae bacterium]
MRKRLFGVRLAVLTAALMAFAVTAAGSATAKTASKASGSVTLKLVVADYGTGPSNTSAKYWAGIVSAFEKANPSIKVKVTTISWTNFDTQVQTMVQNHNYPDITEGDYFSAYAQQGLLYSAKQVLSDPKNLLPVFASQGTYNGKQYGMPWTTSSRTLFYNKKLFTQAGITSAPTSWNSIKADAAKITAKGHIGFGLPLGPEEAQAESLLWFLGDGGNYMKGNTWTINSAANVSAFTFLKNLVAAGDTEPNPGTVDRTPLWEQFAAGKVGMINGSPALIPIIQAGKVLKSSQWASVPIAGKNGPLSDTLGVCDNVAAFKKNGHEAQIKKFLDFAYQNKYQLQFDREYELLPATVSAANALKSDRTFGSFIKALPHAVQYPSNTAWAQVKTDVQNTIGTAVTGDPSTVLGTLQQTATKLGS